MWAEKQHDVADRRLYLHYERPEFRLWLCHIQIISQWDWRSSDIGLLTVFKNYTPSPESGYCHYLSPIPGVLFLFITTFWILAFFKSKQKFHLLKKSFLTGTNTVMAVHFKIFFIDSKITCFNVEMWLGIPSIAVPLVTIKFSGNVKSTNFFFKLLFLTSFSQFKSF